MLFEGKEVNQYLALSLRVNGNNLSLKRFLLVFLGVLALAMAINSYK